MEIEVYADVLCPWCYIGKRRMAAALSQVADRDRFQLVWRSFQLAPDADRIPGPTAAEAMTEWWGERASARVAQIQAVGAAEGLAMNLHIARPVSTFDAHRLCHLAAEHGRADEMWESLLRAYHTEGQNIADPVVLQRVSVQVGLGATEVRDLLAGDAYADKVRADERRAAELGITGVPSVVINGRPPISGVLPSVELLQALQASG
ncbi:MAG TPA: DsbA family oxidoreductase [Micromonosporaceae bacterium]|nr:DsbA family oxidoreductase [Micromonosporaceae bacterium]